MIVAFLRSLVFYPVFYGFSAVLVIASVLALPFGRGPLKRVVALWGVWHRWCIENILDIRIVQEGVIPDEPVLIAVKHESYFDVVENPSDGAYYIEELTNELANQALELFKNIEGER